MRLPAPARGSAHSRAATPWSRRTLCTRFPRAADTRLRPSSAPSALATGWPQIPKDRAGAAERRLHRSYEVAWVFCGQRASGMSGVPRVALRCPEEAAEALGVSLDFFDKHVRLELRLIRRGRLVFVSVRELEEWAEKQAARALEG